MFRSVLVAWTLMMMVKSFAFNSQDFEKEHCSNLLYTGSNNSYKIEEPLVYSDSAGLTHVLQKMRVNNEVFHIWRTTDSSFSINLKSKNKIYDFVIDSGLLWAATDNGLVLYNRRGFVTRAYNLAGNVLAKDQARSVVLVDDQIYLGFGTIGLVKFDLSSRSFSRVHPLNTYQDGEVSAVTSLVYHEDLNELFAVHANSTRKGFKGVVRFNLNSQEISEVHEYENRRDGVIDVNARGYIFSDNLILNNGGWIHSLGNVNKKLSRSRWLGILNQRDSRHQYIQLRGDFIYDNGEIQGCGIYRIFDQANTKRVKLFRRAI